MQRRDFELLSAALRRAKEGIQRAAPTNTTALALRALRVAQHESDCEYIAQAISAQNPSFEVERFLRDSGVEL
jgi:hypothetical protein